MHSRNTIQEQQKQASWGSILLKLLGASAATGGAVVGGRHLYDGITSTKGKLDRLLDNAGDTAVATSKTVNKAQPVVQEALEGVNKAQQTLDRRTKDIAPLMGAGVGAGIGHLLGSLQEHADEQDAEEQRKQKRNRVLLTLLGGAGGFFAGKRKSQGKPILYPSAEEWKSWKGASQQADYLNLLAAAPDADTADALKQVAALHDNPAQLRAELALPALKRLIGYPVGGAALGAATGGLIQALRGRDKEDQDKPSVGRGVVLGGLAGGLLGTGVIPDIPRQVYNGSPYGRALGTIPFADGLKTYLRLLTRDGADEAIPDAMNAAFLKKWGPTLTKP